MPNIQRFIDAQAHKYDIALSEIKNGKKRSHWIWYIFPQLKGLGHSYRSNFYGIDGFAETEEYISNDLLRHRLNEICQALLIHDVDIIQIMGSIDSRKLMSSMTLFDAISPNDVYGMVLDKFYNGQRDDKTLYLLDR